MYCGYQEERGPLKNNKAVRQFLQAEALMFWQPDEWKVKEKVVKRKRGKSLKFFSILLAYNKMKCFGFEPSISKIASVCCDWRVQGDNEWSCFHLGCRSPVKGVKNSL